MSATAPELTPAQVALIAKHGTVSEFTQAVLAAVGEISFREAQEAIREYKREFNEAGKL